MRVLKQTIHPHLRKAHGIGKIITFLYSKQWGIKLLNQLVKPLKGKRIHSLNCGERYIPSRNGGPDIRVRIFRPLNAEGPLPAILFNHGGGYVSMIPETALETITGYIKLRPCIVVAPDYRKAITDPFPAGFNDCYDTLLWMRDNARVLGIKNDKFIIAGVSAGGGLAAAITLKARDTEDVHIAFQMPLYPMLDHRQETESVRDNTGPYWDSKANAMGWALYLKNIKGAVPEYASPALTENHENLPPTITFAGDLDPFKDEVTEYVKQLRSASIPVTFELFNGGFHAFEQIMPRTELGKRAIQFHHESFVEYFDKYMQDFSWCRRPADS